MSITRFGNLFDDYPAGILDPFQVQGIISSAVTRVDSEETTQAHVYKVQVHNFNKENVKVQVEDSSIVHISGEKKAVREDTSDGFCFMESRIGYFSHSVSLPENAIGNELEASTNNDVITIVVPKN